MDRPGRQATPTRAGNKGAAASVRSKPDQPVPPPEGERESSVRKAPIGKIIPAAGWCSAWIRLTKNTDRPYPLGVEPIREHRSTTDTSGARPDIDKTPGNDVLLVGPTAARGSRRREKQATRHGGGRREGSASAPTTDSWLAGNRQRPRACCSRSRDSHRPIRPSTTKINAGGGGGGLSRHGRTEDAREGTIEQKHRSGRSTTTSRFGFGGFRETPSTASGDQDLPDPADGKDPPRPTLKTSRR